MSTKKVDVRKKVAVLVPDLNEVLIQGGYDDVISVLEHEISTLPADVQENINWPAVVKAGANAMRYTDFFREIEEAVRRVLYSATTADKCTPTYVDVEMIASGYEWTCPICGRMWHEIEVGSTVACRPCAARFDLVVALHAEI